jgi:hypothetical protein
MFGEDRPNLGDVGERRRANRARAVTVRLSHAAGVRRGPRP